MKRKELRAKDIYDDFELKKTLLSPWFIQKYLQRCKGYMAIEICNSEDFKLRIVGYVSD